MKANLLNTIAGNYAWCVAGGYAACPQLATDMDVWVLADPEANLEELASDICNRVPEIEPYDADIERSPAYVLDHGRRILKVGTLGHRHIMATECETIQELLDCFDISTHQCALDEDGTFIKGRRWTPITVPPVKLFDTPNTDQRMVKIGARYAPFRKAA